MLIFFSTHALAKTVTIGAMNNESQPWVIATKDDGYIQLLGEGYGLKKFTVYVSPSHNGKTSDTITVECNAGNDFFDTHYVEAGFTLHCYPHFNDRVLIYIDQFQNGSEGTFTYTY